MKRNSPFLLLATVAILVIAFSSFTKGGKKKKFAGYTKSDNGSYYLLHKKGTGTTVVDTGGAVFMKLKFKTAKDSVFLDINQQTHSASYPMLVTAPVFKGDFLDFFAKLHKGDSASFFISLDSLHKYYHDEFKFDTQFDTMKYLGFVVSVDSIYSRAQVVEIRAKAMEAQRVQQEAMAKQQAEMQKAQARMAPIQDSARAKEPYLKAHDFAILSDYIKTKWAGPPNPDNDGIFYMETTPGVGNVVSKGMMLGVRYTGKYLDGTIFDSNNIYPEQQVLNFRLGDGNMIPGFSACISKMKVGTKAVFILPPKMAYNDGLTRMFEVEIVSAQ